MKSLFAFLMIAVLGSSAFADEGWRAPPPPMAADQVIVVSDLTTKWTDPWADRHYSLGGRPFIHGFLTEPAFSCRSMRTDFWASDSNEWATADIAWGLTRRLWARAEVPFAFDNEDETGFGDGELSLNGLLSENNRLLLSQSLNFAIPTGDESRGLGTGDFALSTLTHAWFDTCWQEVTLQGSAGFSYVPDNGEWSFEWSATVAKSFGSLPFYALAEVKGTTPFDGGDTEGLWLLGGGCSLTDRLGLRAGFTCTFEGEPGAVIGLTFDF